MSVKSDPDESLSPQAALLRPVVDSPILSRVVESPACRPLQLRRQRRRHPNADFLVSAEETSQDPTVINYKLNPDAVWGDYSSVDDDDMKAVWKARNGENQLFNCASTEPNSEIEPAPSQWNRSTRPKR